MAIILNQKICPANNCQSFNWYETTGAYSTANTGGWGDGISNDDPTDASNATLAITDPNNDTTTISLISQYPQWPTADVDQYFTIYNTDLNMTNKLQDGLYKFVYTVTMSSGNVYKKTSYKLMFCNIECCVNKMMLSIDPTCESCNKSKMDVATKAQSLLDGLRRASKCGKVSLFNNYLNVLNRLCLNTNCDSCG